jgi:hypothetical protein
LKRRITSGRKSRVTRGPNKVTLALAKYKETGILDPEIATELAAAYNTPCLVLFGVEPFPDPYGNPFNVVVPGGGNTN